MPRQKKCRHRADGEECLLTFPFIGLVRFCVNQAQRRSEQGSSRCGKAELLLYFSPFAVESMFAFIDNVAERRKKKREKITHPSRLRVKRRGDARDSLSLRRN